MDHVLMSLVAGDGGEIFVALVAAIENLGLFVHRLSVTLQIVIVLQILVADFACENADSGDSRRS